MDLKFIFQKRFDLFFITTRLYALFLMPTFLTDVVNYHYYAQKIFGGNAPYRHFLFEYPPFSLPTILLPHWIGDLVATSSFGVYRFIFMLIKICFDYLLFTQIKKKNQFVWTYLFLSSIALPFSLERLDLLMVYFMVSAIICIDKVEYKKALAWISVGGWIKLFPFFCTFGFLKEKKSWHKLLFWAVAINSTLLLLFYFVWGENFSDLFRFHLLRPLQIESHLGSVVLVASKLFQFKAPLIESFGSDNIIFNYHREFLTGLALLQVIYFGGLAYLYYKNPHRMSFVDVATTFILGFLIFGKVLSVQYILWPLALIFLGDVYKNLTQTNRILLYLIYILSTILYLNYMTLASKEATHWHLLLLLRNIFLISVAVEVNVFAWKKLSQTTA